MKEIWKGMIYNNIDYSDKFLISNQGNVYSKYFNRNIRPHIDQNGYYRWVTKIKGKPINFGVHRAVACTFIPNPNNLPQVNHKDCNKLHNFVTNLEWVSNKENSDHAIKNGLIKTQGEDNLNHKLTNDDIFYIRQNYIPYSKQFGANALARKFKVSKTTIIHILQYKLWKHI